MRTGLKIVFAGTPDFAAVSLQALLESDHDVVGVYTQPDRPAGRGQKLHASPVKQLAQDNALTIFQPASLKSAEDQKVLKSLKPDVIVVVAYGLILPKAVLDIPYYGCINVHASLLPRWRGAAPIQRAMLAGDEQTGVTIMQMDEGLDTGVMMMRIPSNIHPEDSGESLHDRLALLGAEALILTLTELQLDRVQPVAQDDAESCYASKLKKSEANLDWTLPAADLWNKIRAFNPWPVAQTQWGDKTLRIWNAEAVSENCGVAPGTVIVGDKEGVHVATGDGILRITELQLPGKRPMAAKDFLNAHSLAGEVFR